MADRLPWEDAPAPSPAPAPDTASTDSAPAETTDATADTQYVATSDQEIPEGVNYSVVPNASTPETNDYLISPADGAPAASDAPAQETSASADPAPADPAATTDAPVYTSAPFVEPVQDTTDVAPDSAPVPATDTTPPGGDTTTDAAPDAAPAADVPAETPVDSAPADDAQSDPAAAPADDSAVDLDGYVKGADPEVTDEDVTQPADSGTGAPYSGGDATVPAAEPAPEVPIEAPVEADTPSEPSADDPAEGSSDDSPAPAQDTPDPVSDGTAGSPGLDSSNSFLRVFYEYTKTVSVDLTAWRQEDGSFQISCGQESIPADQAKALANFILSGEGGTSPN